MHVERVYQMDDDGNINKENFVEIERLKKIKVKNRCQTVLFKIQVTSIRIRPKRDNVESSMTIKSRGASSRIMIPAWARRGRGTTG